MGNIFPGTDGSLYTYVASHAGSRPLIEACLHAGHQWPVAKHSRLLELWVEKSKSCLAAFDKGALSPAIALPHLQRLPLGVSDLVNQSPVTALDGSMLIGSQHTSVFLLDSRTGQLLRQAGWV